MADSPNAGQRLRFSLRWLFTVVTVVAIGCAALANPTALWASVVFSGTVVLLVSALLIATVRKGKERVSAVGFAICGWAYLGLILWPGAKTNIVPNLVTTEALVEAQLKLHGPVQSTFSLLDGDSDNQRFFISSSGQALSLLPTWASPFQRIGHCLFALLFAAVGSAIARWLWSRDGNGSPPRRHDAGPSAGEGSG